MWKMMIYRGIGRGRSLGLIRMVGEGWRVFIRPDKKE